MLCALIMAGGKGERFWPLSTEEKPKQFLNLLGDDTMIQMTVKRIEKLIPIEHIFIVTASRYVSLVKEQLPQLPERNIIGEPIGKNTAPCIGLSAFIINKYYKDAAIMVLPSDHLIKDEEKFRSTLKAGYKFVINNDNAIVTLGIRPNRPETGYGYIKYNKLDSKIGEFEFKEVDKFVEKPDLNTAKQYISSGDYLWNGGMFIWKTSTILNLTNQYLDKTYKILNEIAISNDEEFEEVLNEKYPQVDSISIDYGIMEKANNIYVIPSEFGWDDLGTWASVERYREKDSVNNVSFKKDIFISSRSNLVASKKKQVVVIGVDDILTVENDDQIFIINKKLMEDVKYIKQQYDKVKQ